MARQILDHYIFTAGVGKASETRSRWKHWKHQKYAPGFTLCHSSPRTAVIDNTTTRGAAELTEKGASELNVQSAKSRSRQQVRASHHPGSVQAKGWCPHSARWWSTARFNLSVLWAQRTHLKNITPFWRVLLKKHAHTESPGPASRSAHPGTSSPSARGSISSASNQAEVRT